MLIKVSVGSLLTLLVALPLAAADTSSTNLAALFGDPVIARTKSGFEVKRSQLDEEAIRIKAQLTAAGQQVPQDRMQLLEQGVLEQLISLHLLNDRATAEDKAKGKELADKRLAEAKTKLGSEELFNMRLKAENLTFDQLVSKWIQAAIAETVVRREIKAEVTDADVKKFYDENPGRFEQPEMVRASHILLSTRDDKQKELPDEEKAAKRKKAEAALKRAKAGEDFAALVKEYSEDPGSRDKGGEYTFPRGRMVPEFEAAAFSLNTNQVSDIVTTQFGYHIIKLYEKIPAKKQELAKVSSDLKEALIQQAIQKQLPAYMKKLKEEAGLEILDDRYKPRESASASTTK